MKKSMIVLQSALLFGLMACQAPTTPEPQTTAPATETSESTGTPASTSTSVTVDTSVDVGANAGSSTTPPASTADANSQLTVEANGQTYTRGQLKSYYGCAASKDSAFKGPAALIKTDIEAADAGNPAAEAIYVRAATNLALYQSQISGCSL
jgi:hypothetical protein